MHIIKSFLATLGVILLAVLTMATASALTIAFAYGSILLVVAFIVTLIFNLFKLWFEPADDNE